MKKFRFIIPILFMSLISFSQKTIPATTIIVVRHAEKADDSRDTNLSADGLLRAEVLKNTLCSVAVNAIYSTPYNRTRQTVTPLATEKGITITEYPANKPYGDLVSEVLKAYRGKIIVIAGHSNTVPEILKTLSNNSFNVTINENQFDNLFIVTYTDKKNAVVLPLKYGKSTP